MTGDAHGERRSAVADDVPGPRDRRPGRRRQDRSRGTSPKANQGPADEAELVLDAQAWEAFVEELERPVHSDPRLVELFARPRRITY